MNIEVQKVEIEQKLVLRNLLELYQYEFTEFDDEDVNEYGLYGYTYLDHYWTDGGRFPFLIKVNGKIAGFVFVRNISTEGGKENIYSIAEFFVLKKYRNKGVGKKVAFFIFDTFPGTWKVAQIETNLPAQSFWRKVIGQYTGDKYKELREDGWDGPIQRFITIKV